MQFNWVSGFASGFLWDKITMIFINLVQKRRLNKGGDNDEPCSRSNRNFWYELCSN